MKSECVPHTAQVVVVLFWVPVKEERELAHVLMVAHNTVVAAVAAAVEGPVLLHYVPDHLPLVPP